MEINALDQIRKFQDFIEAHYYEKLLENTRKGDKFLLVDFADLSKFDIDLANELLEEPEESIKAIEKSIGQFDLEEVKSFKVRFHNLPKSANILVRDIR